MQLVEVEEISSLLVTVARLSLEVETAIVIYPRRLIDCKSDDP